MFLAVKRFSADQTMFLDVSFYSDVKKIESTQNVEELSEQKDNFDACFGALKLIKDGWETEAIPQSKSDDNNKNNFFSKIFSNLT